MWPTGKSWFKRIDLGEKFGEIIIAHASSLEGKDLAKKFYRIKEWVRADD